MGVLHDDDMPYDRLPPISTMGLGRISVSSANLDPSPPARIPTFISNLQPELGSPGP
jgi:hypothetical protein